MAKRTQKAGATKRAHGSRYGVEVRRRAGASLKKKSRNYTCPVCHYQKGQPPSLLESGSARSVGTSSLEEYGNHSLEQPMLNTRVVRRGIEGATATDMTVIVTGGFGLRA